MDSKSAMEALKSASATGDLAGAERIYADACSDLGNIIQDKAALCLYTAYIFLNAKEYGKAEQYLLEALAYSNDPTCRGIRGTVLFYLFRLKWNLYDEAAAVHYGQMAMIELENSLPDSQSQIEYIRTRIG